MNILEGKNILLGVTGGIAAYKSPDLVRRLREMGAHVRVVMTQGAQSFITPMTMQTVSSGFVYTDMFEPRSNNAMDHIELARWADYVIVAPASANFIARLSHGLSDDLLTTIGLVTTAPIILAPAMNKNMWGNALTQQNIERLKNQSVMILGPGEGEQACGEVGVGRMLEPIEIITQFLNVQSDRYLKGKQVLITAGPTREAIDPVRFITNRSTGKMGYALAKAAYAAGATVKLVSGPVSIPPPVSVETIIVDTATHMHDIVCTSIYAIDIFIACAAVSDYRCEYVPTQKIKKSSETLHLKLIRNPDILSSIAHMKTKPYTVGFAAETENLVENAKQKLRAKNADMIVANKVGDRKGFEVDHNELIAFWRGGEQLLSRAHKTQLARSLVKLISERYTEQHNAVHQESELEL